MTIQTITADGTGQTVIIANRNAVVSKYKSVSRDVIVIATGTFGGGTLQIQRQDSAGTWYDIPNASYTNAFAVKIADNTATPYRYTMTGSTSPSVTIRFT